VGCEVQGLVVEGLGLGRVTGWGRRFEPGASRERGSGGGRGRGYRVEGKPRGAADSRQRAAVTPERVSWPKAAASLDHQPSITNP
jgi:hypothetical protein